MQTAIAVAQCKQEATVLATRLIIVKRGHVLTSWEGDERERLSGVRLVTEIVKSVRVEGAGVGVGRD